MLLCQKKSVTQALLIIRSFDPIQVPRKKTCDLAKLNPVSPCICQQHTYLTTRKHQRKNRKQQINKLNTCENVLNKNNFEKNTLKNNPQKLPSKVIFFYYIVIFFDQNYLKIVKKITATYFAPNNLTGSIGSTATIHAQCSPPDLNHDHPRPVFAAGTQPPEKMPKDMPDRMPDRTSDRVPDRMSEDMPDRMPDRMPERTSDRVPDRMSEDTPDRMSEDMPDRMSEDMTDRMSEDMPDRMSEDTLKTF